MLKSPYALSPYQKSIVAVVVLCGCCAHKWLYNTLLLPFDRWFLTSVHDYSTPWVEQLALVITRCADPLPLSLFVLLVLYGLKMPFARARRILCFFGIVLLVCFSLKWLTGRTRPDLWISLRPEAWYSFPSGHTLMAGVVSHTIVRLIVEQYPARKCVLCWLARLYTLAVGWSRLSLGVHWPTDVIASLILAHVSLRFFQVNWSASSRGLG